MLDFAKYGKEAAVSGPGAGDPHRWAVSDSAPSNVTPEGVVRFVRSCLQGLKGLHLETIMSNLNPLPFIAVSAAVLLSAAPASAHARLVSSTPAATSTVASPRVVTLTFSDRVAPAFSGFDLVNAAGATIRVQTRVSEDGKTISGAPARPLATGAYVVNWRVASPDGHRMTGSTNFSVR